MEAFLDAKIFPLILLLLGLFEFLSTYLDILPLVQQKRLLEERVITITDPVEKADLVAHIGHYNVMFFIFRIIGVLLIAFGLWGLL